MLYRLVPPQISAVLPLHVLVHDVEVALGRFIVSPQIHRSNSPLPVVILFVVTKFDKKESKNCPII
jgi:hypothetical protein